MLIYKMQQVFPVKPKTRQLSLIYRHHDDEIERERQEQQLHSNSPLRRELDELIDQAARTFSPPIKLRPPELQKEEET